MRKILNNFLNAILNDEVLTFYIFILYKNSYPLAIILLYIKKYNFYDFYIKLLYKHRNFPYK